MTPRSQRSRLRTNAGVAFPSPVVILSVVAVVMAGISFIATRDQAPTEQRITTVAEPSASASPAEPEVAAKSEPIKKKKQKKPLDRSAVYVVVFNNSGITGLAGQYSGTATNLGWQVVGSDNWYGTIPTSTVYYPPKLAEAEQLALDLGIGRVAPAVDPMSPDRLTVILTADAA